MQSNPRINIMPLGTCPSGGKWFECAEEDPFFIGCCTNNPCDGTGCPEKYLRAAGIPPGSSPHDASPWPNVRCSQGLWWRCSEQTPTFQGCCDADPCDGLGCPRGMLHAATFITPPSTTSTFITKSPSSQATHSSSSLLSKSSTSALPTGSANPIPEHEHSKIPIIAGSAIGGFVLAILLGLGYFFLRCRRRKAPAATGQFELLTGGPARKLDIITTNAPSPESPYNDQPTAGVVESKRASQYPSPFTPSPAVSPGLPSYPGSPHGLVSPRSSSHVPSPTTQQGDSTLLYPSSYTTAYQDDPANSSNIPQLDSAVVHEMPSNEIQGVERSVNARSSYIAEGNDAETVNGGPSPPVVQENRTGNGTLNRDSYTSWQHLKP